MQWLARHRGVTEFGIVGLCLLIYFLVRGNVVDRPLTAFEHAIDVVALERRLGFFWEPAWQRAIQGDVVQIHFWNYVYFWAHAPVIVPIAFWLYFRHRREYTLIRNAFLFSALIGICIYAIYPTAPPRLLTPEGYAEFGVRLPPPQYGFADTMRAYSNVSYQAESLRPFVNPFAAMPSLHFGWAFLIGLGVALALRNALGLLTVVALPLLMLFGIVLTANHFIFDAVAGLGVVLVALVAAIALERLPERHRKRFVPPFLRPAPPPATVRARD